MYDPSEDSFLLKKCLERFLKGKKLDLCVDMGAGSGIQGLAVAPFAKRILCVDVNPEVVLFLNDLFKDNFKFSIIESDLFLSVPEKFKGKVDLIAFNPPYLPREACEVDDLELTSGVEGVDLTLRFLSDCVYFLKPEGRLFFVASSLANISLIESKLVELDFKFKISGKEHIFFEDILVYEAWRI
ncbi:MAG: HemK2/MTQ2 family protein methyltransferase [Candidatus Woesearchaeota archaeon]